MSAHQWGHSLNPLDIFATYYIGYNPMDVLTTRISIDDEHCWEDRLDISEVNELLEEGV